MKFGLSALLINTDNSFIQSVKDLLPDKVDVHSLSEYGNAPDLHIMIRFDDEDSRDDLFDSIVDKLDTGNIGSYLIKYLCFDDEKPPKKRLIEDYHEIAKDINEEKQSRTNETSLGKYTKERNQEIVDLKIQVDTLQKSVESGGK